jgi:hypothetical protein
MFSMSSLSSLSSLSSRSSLRRIAWPLAVVGAAVLVAPTVAWAATGSFSSSTSTPAVRATNSSTGLAIDATSKGTVIRSTGSGTGGGAAMFLRQTSTGNNSNALYAKTYVASGVHYGAWGVNVAAQGAGVRGEGTNANGGDGVIGTASSAGGAGVYGGSPGVGVIGAGGEFGVLSLGDTAGAGNVYDFSDGGWAGTCNATGTSNPCTFGGTPFLDPTVKPVVVVTPQGDPGGSYWVTGANANGFTLRLATAPAGEVVFGYQVVGTISAGARSSEKASAVTDAKARTHAGR